MHCSICKFPFPPHELYPRYGQEGAKCLECLGKERDELLTRLEATAKGAFDGMQALAKDNADLRKKCSEHEAILESYQQQYLEADLNS